MRKVKELQDGFDKLTSDDLKKEIAERRSLIQQMVGSLYPRIVEGEIEQIQELLSRRWKVEGVLVEIERSAEAGRIA